MEWLLFSLMVVAFVAIVAGWFWFVRGIEAMATRGLTRCYEGFAVRSADSPAPGDVTIVFHTYHGFLIGFTQTEHAAALHPDDAREFLRKLNRFNLTWGLLARGAIFVPILSLLNYCAQCRSIRRQEAMIDSVA